MGGGSPPTPTDGEYEDGQLKLKMLRLPRPFQIYGVRVYAEDEWELVNPQDKYEIYGLTNMRYTLAQSVTGASTCTLTRWATLGYRVACTFISRAYLAEARSTGCNCLESVPYISD